jgi:hypothetical protein
LCKTLLLQLVSESGSKGEHLTSAGGKDLGRT